MSLNTGVATVSLMLLPKGGYLVREPVNRINQITCFIHNYNFFVTVT